MSTRRIAPFRLASAVVVVLIVAVAAVGTFFTHRAVQSEEHRLLKERSSEIGLILTEAFSTLQTQMSAVASQTKLGGGDTEAFAAAADAAGPAQPGSSLALADASGPTVMILTTAQGPALPSTVTGERAAVIQRALTVRPVAVATAVFDMGTSHFIGIGYRVGTGGLVIYRESLLNPTAAGSATSAQQPFRELQVALYDGPTQARNTLILTTGGSVPLEGSVVTSTTPFGADNWLVAVKATSPLVGTFAANGYLLVLIGGLLFAAALGALTESLGRRRDYALALVDERTAELQDAQEQLLRQTRLAAIGELASAVGHELRNPLAVISNAHYLLRSHLEPESDERALRQLSTAEREVAAATLIVGDLLDFARARAPVTTRVDVKELIDEVFGVAPPPPNIAVSDDTPPDCPPVQADRDQLRQVLLNLTTNAYEAMPNGGSLAVAVRARDGRLQVTVTDSGIGMDDETKVRLFEPFFTRKARGIGLGLAVTKRIVEAHSGTITVESQEGRGTTFTVDLPLAPAGAAAEPSS